MLAWHENKWPSQSYIKVVELRGLEPLTFSLRKVAPARGRCPGGYRDFAPDAF